MHTLPFHSSDFKILESFIALQYTIFFYSHYPIIIIHNNEHCIFIWLERD